jgi:sugar phosphate isomerase/epimerase
MNADPAAMIRYASDAGVLKEVHMADSLSPAQMWIRDHFDAQPYHSHLVPGKGSLDIRSAVKVLLQIDFQGPVLQIPYRYGIADKSFVDLAIDSKKVVERLARGR